MVLVASNARASPDIPRTARAETAEVANAKLHFACRHGLVDAVKEQLYRGAAIDCFGPDGTPLQIACRFNQFEVVSALCDADAKIDLADASGWTPLQIACHEGHADCVAVLCKRNAKVNLADNENGFTPLHRTAQAGHTECAALLFIYGAAVDVTDANGRTALHHVCLRGHAETAQLLCERGAKTDVVPANGMTPVHAACYQGSAACVRLLCERGAALELTDIDGDTPLMVARERGHESCVQILEAFISSLAETMAMRAADADAMAALLVAEEELEKKQQRSTSHAAAPRKKAKERKRRSAATAKERYLGESTSPRNSDNSTPSSTPLSSPALGASISSTGAATVPMMLLNDAPNAADAANAADADAADAADESDGTGGDVNAVAVNAVAVITDGTGGVAAEAASGVNASRAARADEALVEAMASGDADTIAQAIEMHRLVASEAGLAAARASRDQLCKRRKKQSQRARHRHAGAMAALRTLESVIGAQPLDVEALRGGVAAAGCFAGTVPALDDAVVVAVGLIAQLSLESSSASADKPTNSPAGQVAAPGPMAGGGAGTSGAAVSRADNLHAEAAVVATACRTLPLLELVAATSGFSEARVIGVGGFGRVFAAEALPSLPRERRSSTVCERPVAVKKAFADHALEGHSENERREIQREIKLLRSVDHPHLLPLLGYHVSRAALCLVFPLMCGGSLEDRLHPAKAAHCVQWTSLLGLPSVPAPLTWRERLRAMSDAISALIYLHTQTASKASVLHRDFKTANVLLDERMRAYLADTGFAKATRRSGEDANSPSRRSDTSNTSSVQTTTRGLCYTPGYADSVIVNGGDYSVVTDGYAVGVALLVCLTVRSEVEIFDQLEEEHNLDFHEIDGSAIADPTGGWPADAATIVKNLVRSAGCGLCHSSKRKRTALPEVLRALTQLTLTLSSSSAPLDDATTDVSDAGLPPAAAAPAVAAAEAAHVPTPLSVQVRGLRVGDAKEALQRNVSNAFDAAMRRLEVLYQPNRERAPPDFEGRINFWHLECGMGRSLRDELHQLRIWRNASDHHDDERWHRLGPSNADVASALLSRIAAALAAVERPA